MLALLWLKGLLRYRAGRLAGATLGVAARAASARVARIFIASSAAQMTRRAIADVPVDWQIQLTPGTDPQTAIAAIGAATHI